MECSALVIRPFTANQNAFEILSLYWNRFGLDSILGLSLSIINTYGQIHIDSNDLCIEIVCAIKSSLVFFYDQIISSRKWLWEMVSHEIDNFNIWLVYGELSSKEEKKHTATNPHYEIDSWYKLRRANFIISNWINIFHYLFLVCSSLRLRYPFSFIVFGCVFLFCVFVQSGACLTLRIATEARSTLISLAIWCLRAWITVHTHSMHTHYNVCTRVPNINNQKK